MAKTAGTNINGYLAGSHERICGHKGYSYDYYQYNEREKGKGKKWLRPFGRGKVRNRTMHSIGYEDCDWISLESHHHDWEEISQSVGKLEFHVPCREPISHLLSACNYLEITFDCESQDLMAEIEACNLGTDVRFSSKLLNYSNGPLKCFDPFPLDRYLTYMDQILQPRRIPVAEVAERTTNKVRNKNKECLWNPEYAKQKATVTSAMAFNFGGGTPAPAPAGGGGGFNFGGASAAGAPAAAPPPGGGFSFGGAAAAPATTGGAAAPSFSFGAPAPAAPVAAAPAASSGRESKRGFGGDGNTRAAPAPPGGAGGFSFGGGAAPAPAAPAGGGFSFGGAGAAPAPAAPAGGGFSFGGAAPTPAPSAPAPAPAGGGGFSFGGAAPAPAAPAPAAPVAAGGFSFGGAAAGAATSTPAPPAPTPAPAAGGGFSFGGSAPAPAAPAPAPTSESESKKRDKKTGGFSFGGAAPATATATAAPATTAPSQLTTPTAAAGGGFSFGGGAANTPATPKTDAPAPVATPAPVTTPNAMPPTSAAAAGGTPAAAPTPAPAPPKAPEPAALEYQSLTVEQILNKFQKELEVDSIAFLDQAKRVCEYDAVLRDSQRDIAQITDQTQRLLLEQEQMEKALQGIDSFQVELSSTLDTVSTHVDELFTSQSHLAPQDADVERERAYQMSQTIAQRLDELENGLGDTMKTLSDHASDMGNGKNSLLTILNQHQNAILSLEGAAHKLEGDVKQVKRIMDASAR
ncbi:MAG: hypothetical protein SGBAC_011253 [Bacillariaceae sp.]